MTYTYGDYAIKYTIHAPMNTWNEATRHACKYTNYTWLDYADSIV